MRIRMTGVLAALTVSALVATGCSSGSPEPDSTQPGGSLLIWADDQRAAALAPFAEAFGQENGVTVTVEAISQDLQTNFVTASQAGTGPDIVIGAHDWIGNLVQNGTIDPVHLTAEQEAAFAEVALQAVSFDGQTYGVPYAIENVALIRNTDLAPNAPATIEELVATGQALVAEGKVTNILSLQVGQNGDTYHIYPLFTAGGGYLFGKQANGAWNPEDVGVNSPGSVAAFTKIRDLGEAGSGALTRSISGDNAIPTFTSGGAAFLVSGPWAIADIKKAGINYEISPVPPFAGGPPASPFVGVQAFFVASKGKNKALAVEFVTNYAAKPEIQKALYEANPRPPALKAALEEVAATDPDIDKWFAAGENGTPMPNIPQMAAIWDPFNKASAAIVGGADVQSTLDAAQETIVEAIGS
ncbi:MAG: maltose ABC transporter substrate-binding protein [Micromonosporaceae bacterium]|nr:maltose ABC transporter substrate-binding protein [Micromonosporaceae bacterium]